MGCVGADCNFIKVTLLLINYHVLHLMHLVKEKLVYKIRTLRNCCQVIVHREVMIIPPPINEHNTYSAINGRPIYHIIRVCINYQRFFVRTLTTTKVHSHLLQAGRYPVPCCRKATFTILLTAIFGTCI